MDYIQTVFDLIWPPPPSPTSGSRLLTVACSHVQHKKVELEKLHEEVEKGNRLRGEKSQKCAEAQECYEACDQLIWEEINQAKAGLNKFTIQIRRVENAVDQETLIQLLREACILTDELNTDHFTARVAQLKKARDASELCLQTAKEEVGKVNAHLATLQKRCDHIVDHIATLERIQTQLSTTLEQVSAFTVEESLDPGDNRPSRTDTE